MVRGGVTANCVTANCEASFVDTGNALNFTVMAAQLCIY